MNPPKFKSRTSVQVSVCLFALAWFSIGSVLARAEDNQPQAAAAAAPAPEASAAPAPSAAPAAVPAATDAAKPAETPAATTGDAAKPADDKKVADDKKSEEEREPAAYDFEHEDTFIDVPDALRSRQFVHRAILSTVIHDTARVTLGSSYFSSMLGMNAIYQPSNQGGKSFAKYASGVLGFNYGYSTKGGHAFELGLDLSGVTQLMPGYKYYFQSATSTFWPFLGAGFALELPLRLSDVPIEAQVYKGKTFAEFASVGAIIPLVDVALRAEAKFIFYGLDRLILDTGIGVTFFF